MSRRQAPAQDPGTDMNVQPPADRLEDRDDASTREAMLGVVAEFDLNGTHCLLVPVDASPGETPSNPPAARGRNGCGQTGHCPERPAGARPLCSFALDGRHYMLYARAGPGHGADADGEDPLASLTAREQQIVRLVCLGLVNKQIADRLRISEYTVKTYLKQIFCKLNVHSRSAMVYRCAAWSTLRPLRHI